MDMAVLAESARTASNVEVVLFTSRKDEPISVENSIEESAVVFVSLFPKMVKPPIVPDVAFTVPVMVTAPAAVQLTFPLATCPEPSLLSFVFLPDMTCRVPKKSITALRDGHSIIPVSGRIAYRSVRTALYGKYSVFSQLLARI